jgi:hypothetical protein
LVLALSACATDSGVVSGSSDAPATPSPAANPTQPASLAATPYYVEFRTRPYFTITHTYLVFGAQDSSGHPLEWKTMGFFPNGGALGPFIGIVGITGKVGEEAYYAKLPSSVTFRRSLTAEQYERLTRYVDEQRGKSEVYNLFFNNCNDFVAGAAAAIGLKVPLLAALPPPLFIMLLRQMNT